MLDECVPLQSGRKILNREGMFVLRMCLSA